MTMPLSGARTSTGSLTEAMSNVNPERDKAELVSTPGRRRRFGTRKFAAVIAIALGLVVLAGGAVAAESQTPKYNASATLLVLPEASSSSSLASLYDALSQGQIVGSVQAVISSRGFVHSALEGSSGAPITGASVSATLVPSTSLIDVTGKASSAATAERASDAVADRAVGTLTTRFSPYKVTLVSSASGTAKTSGTSKSTLLGIVALLAVIAAVAAYQAVRFLQSKRAGGGSQSGPASLG